MSTSIRALAGNLMKVNHVEELKEAGAHALEGGVAGFVLATIAKNRRGGLDVDGKPADLGAGALGLILAPYLGSVGLSRNTQDRVRRLSEVAFGIGVYNKVAGGGSLGHGGHFPAHGEETVMEAARRL